MDSSKIIGLALNRCKISFSQAVKKCRGDRKGTKNLDMLEWVEPPEGKDAAKEFPVIPLPETLTETERKIFLRRYWYLETSQEIAERLGISQRRVKAMLHRIRVKLEKENPL